MNFKGLVLEHQLVLPPDPAVAAWLGRHEGEPVAVTIEAAWTRRTPPQNRRIWAGYRNVLLRASATFNLDKNDLHECMKARSEVLPPVRIYLPSGEPLATIKTTRTIPVPIMSDFQEEVGAFWAERGIDAWPERGKA